MAAAHYVEAAGALERAVKLAPESWRAWTLLGFCRLKQRRFAESLEACTRALELKPDEARASLWAAVSLKGLRRYDEAVEAYEKLLESNPGRGVEIECHWGLAECRLALDKKDEAARHAQEAVRTEVTAALTKVLGG